MLYMFLCFNVTKNPLVNIFTPPSTKITNLTSILDVSHTLSHMALFTSNIQSTLINTICGTVIGVYAGKKLIDFLNYEREPKYNCIFLYNQGIRATDPNKPLSYLNFFVDFVNEAKFSLDICFFLITDGRVVKSIIEAKKRNVAVRIITDYEKGMIDNYAVRNLYKAGLQVYHDKCSANKSLMHHKFCVRDRKTLLQASVNLTESASIGSYDNVIITEDPEFLVPFRNHFDELVNMME